MHVEVMNIIWKLAAGQWWEVGQDNSLFPKKDFL